MTWILGVIALIVLLGVVLALLLQFSTSLDKHASLQRKQQFFHDELRAPPPDEQDTAGGDQQS